MKKTVLLLLVGYVSFAVAQQAPQAPKPAPAQPQPTPTTPAPNPASAPAPKKTARPAIVEPTVSIAPGLAIVSGKNVNLRARASISSEAVAQLNAGDTVTVIEQINLDKFKPEEPRQWAKIALPESVDLWVHASFVNRATMTVSANRLNVRFGPGENFSVATVLDRGTPVKEILTDGNWMRVAAPAEAHAFVAAMYLRQDVPSAAPLPVVDAAPAPEPVAPVETVITPAEPAPVAPVDTVSTPAETAPVVTEDDKQANSANLMSMPAPALQPTETIVEPLPPRIVSHEGIVTTTKSIQAPTEYQIVDPQTGKRINYLHTTSPNLNLALYYGLRIIVTGEESLEPRWKTPVITIRRIQVIE